MVPPAVTGVSSEGVELPVLPPLTRALIIDDDSEVASLLKARLETRGFDVATAMSGEAGLAELHTSQPDIVFLDVSMPGMDGLAVLASLREQQLDLSVIMTTAVESVDVAIEALRLGADDYLRKPFDVASFQTVLDRTVSRLQLSRQNAALWRRIGEQRLRLDRELARAAEMQADLLPPAYPLIPGFGR